MTLKANHKVKKGKENQALAVEAANVITECQTKLKGLVLKCLEINLSDLKLKVQKSFAASIPKIAEGVITHDNVMNYTSHQAIVDLLATNYDTVTCHLTMAKEDFIKLYCEVSKIDNLPFPTGRLAIAATATHQVLLVPQQNVTSDEDTTRMEEED